MWKTLVKLFYAGDARPAALPWRETVLREQSPRLPTPPGMGSVQLWPHQEAMLSRCSWIERNPTTARTRIKFAERMQGGAERFAPRPPERVAIGVMNDPPGAGKTYAILALVAMDERADAQTVVVVPKNVVAQWEAALARCFADGAQSWKTLDYESIDTLYRNEASLAGFRVLLLPELLTDSFALANQRSVLRVVIDEVDNVARAMTQPIACERLWFLSASFDPDDDATLEALPYELDRALLGNLVCCTDKAFMSASIPLPSPVMEEVVCADRDVRLFEDLVPPAVLRSLYAGSVRSLLKRLQLSSADLRGAARPRLSDVARAYAAACADRAAHAREAAADTSRRAVRSKSEDDPGVRDQVEKNIAEAAELDRVSALLEARLEGFEEPAADRTKRFYVEDRLAPRVLADEASKWLVFNDDQDGIVEACQLLAARGVACETLMDGGNAADVARMLERFRDGSTRALFINSMSEGCGLNLEAASHVLFMHETEPALVEQIVGRAQRFGRSGPLTIVGLFGRAERGGLESPAAVA